MQVKKRTPRTDMQYRALLRKFEKDTIDILAERFETEPIDVDMELQFFFDIAVRVDWDQGELDFEVPLATDTLEQIIEKFAAYLASERIARIEVARIAIREHDRPADDEIAPKGK